MNLNDLEREKDKPDIEALSWEFARLAGICWHEKVKVTANAEILCSCGKIFFPNGFDGHCNDSNPDFTDAREVLKVMRAREDWIDFVEFLCRGQSLVYQKYSGAFIMAETICDITGLLLIEAVEFLRKGVE